MSLKKKVTAVVSAVAMAFGGVAVATSPVAAQ